MIKAESATQAQYADIAHVKGEADKYRGRNPSYSRYQIQLLASLAARINTTNAARATELSRQAVLRIRTNPQDAYARVAKWG